MSGVVGPRYNDEDPACTVPPGVCEECRGEGFEVSMEPLAICRWCNGTGCAQS